MPRLVKKKKMCNPNTFLDEQDLKDIAESQEAVRQGRVFTHEEVGKILGFR
jgi:predicted transcriptional regulator